MKRMWDNNVDNIKAEVNCLLNKERSADTHVLLETNKVSVSNHENCDIKNIDSEIIQEVLTEEETRLIKIEINEEQINFERKYVCKDKSDLLNVGVGITADMEQKMEGSQYENNCNAPKKEEIEKDKTKGKEINVYYEPSREEQINSEIKLNENNKKRKESVMQHSDNKNNKKEKNERRNDEIKSNEINYEKQLSHVNNIEILEEKDDEIKEAKNRKINVINTISGRKVNNCLENGIIQDNTISKYMSTTQNKNYSDLDEDSKDKPYNEDDENSDSSTSYSNYSDSSARTSTSNTLSSEKYPCNTDVARPHVSKQMKTKYCENRGELRLPFNVDILIPGSNDLDPENLRLLIRDTLQSSRNIKCRMTFGTLRKNKRNHVLYSICRANDCRQKFKFDIVAEWPLETTIFISSTNHSDEIHCRKEDTNYQVRQKERLKLRQELKNIEPRLYQLYVIDTIDKYTASSGNMQKARSLSVYQKARSEEASKYDLTLSSMELQDLNQLWLEENKMRDPFLRYIELPLSIVMYNEEKLVIIGPGKALRADATGNCCGQPTFIEAKRVYYYAFVTYICGRVFPVLELVTTNHDTANISVQLKRFRNFVENVTGAWPYFPIVIMDWSWVFIHSFVREWNSTNVHEYLRKCYECVINQDVFPKEWSIILTCVVHFLKRVYDRLNEKEPEFIGLSLIMDCMAFMVQCKTIKELDSVFRKMITILIFNYENEAEKARKELCQMRFEGFDKLSNPEKEEVKLENEEDEKEENERQKLQDKYLKEKNDKMPIYKNSPFHGHYTNILEEIKTEFEISSINEEGRKNKHQSLKLAIYIVDHFMPFVPIWSAIILSTKNSDISHVHNQHIEAHFHTVKYTLLRRKKDMPLGRFVRELKNYSRSLTTSIRSGINYKGSKTAKPEFSNQESLIPRHNDPALQKVWKKGKNKRPRKKSTHFESKNLKRSLLDDVNITENKNRKKRTRCLKANKSNVKVLSKNRKNNNSRKEEIKSEEKKQSLKRKYQSDISNHETYNMMLAKDISTTNIETSKKLCTEKSLIII